MVKDKTCTGCGETKPLTAFTNKVKSKDGKNPRCRLCTRAMVQKHYDRNGSYYRKKQLDRKRAAKLNFDAIIKKVKDAPCADCGNKFPTCAMDFDHVRGKKRFCVSAAIGMTTNVKVLLEEIVKCEVVCSNCHRIRTYMPS